MKTSRLPKRNSSQRKSLSHIKPANTLNQDAPHWHTLESNEVLDKVGSSKAGLGHDEAARRLAQYGPNEIEAGAGKSVFQIFLSQFSDFMIIILIVTSIISGFIGDLTDTLVILGIIVINAILGFVQEFRTERAIQALKKIAALSAKVVREGQTIVISAAKLVPGDVVLLEAGNVVPADLRIIESNHLRIEEASLTGESVPVDKHVHAIPEANVPLGDMLDMAFKGTSIVYGRGLGVVVQTGLQTELGKIALLLQGGDGSTPLQKRLAAFGKKLTYIIIVICAAVFVTGLFEQRDPVIMLLTSLSLAVAAIPETLPAVVTISLALGVNRMVKQNALIRKLPAVETLGSVTFICTDKTGTLTMNKMQVVQFAVDGDLLAPGEIALQKEKESVSDLFTALALNNDVILSGDRKAIGDPTELALAEAAKLQGYSRSECEESMPRVAEIPFDSVRKCMTTVHRAGDGFIAYTKGAPDTIMPLAESDHHRKLQKAIEAMTNEGLRVLMFCKRTLDKLPDEITPSTIERDWTILGIAGMMDPPREEVKAAIAECRTAGIATVLITGDHVNSAKSIAHKLDIIRDDGDKVLTGTQLAALSDSAFQEIVESVRVYARVSPTEKLRIVQALQKRGQIVAMTGDGVNDAPALKNADIGVAMGISGTDVSKEAAHMILLDDNFATIVKAVSRGRRIYDNIRNFIRYVLSGNLAEIITVFIAPLLGLPVPLLPIHILWINLVTDGLPGLALAAEPAAGNTMQRPPRSPNENLFSRGMGLSIVIAGTIMGAATIGTQAIAIHEGDAHWQTLVFTQLSFLQLAYAFANRSERESLVTIGLFSNKSLLLAVGVAAAMQLATVYVPFLNPVFRTQRLTFDEMSTILLTSLGLLVIIEIQKAFVRARK